MVPLNHDTIVRSPPGKADLERGRIVPTLGLFIRQPIFCSGSADGGRAGTGTGERPASRRQRSGQRSPRDKERKASA